MYPTHIATTIYPAAGNPTLNINRRMFWRKLEPLLEPLASIQVAYEMYHVALHR